MIDDDACHRETAQPVDAVIARARWSHRGVHRVVLGKVDAL
jgi:hypothetical protein